MNQILKTHNLNFTTQLGYFFPLGIWGGAVPYNVGGLTSLFYTIKLQDDIYPENSQGYTLMKVAQEPYSHSDNNQIKIHAFLKLFNHPSPSNKIATEWLR